jgi:hypothetical protein
MWIQAIRDPKKNWLEMRYCASREEVNWIVKYWPIQWEVPTTKKGAKPKEQVEEGTSKKTSSPTENTRKDAKRAQASGSSATMKNPRKKETMSREEVKDDDKNGETSQSKEEDAHKKKTEALMSQKKRTGTKEEEIVKKMKYHKNPPIITVTEDDVELVADKVQDKGEDLVRTIESQREEIMAKLVEVHDTLQRL